MMNERIKQLWDKANLQWKDEFEQASEPRECRTARDIFAELIVQECMMVVEGFTIEQEVALDDYQEYEASAVLKEHFGVEE